MPPRRLPATPARRPPLPARATPAPAYCPAGSTGSTHSQATPGVADIDWAAPWLADWRALGQPLAARMAAGQVQAQVLSAAASERQLALRFVPQSQLPEAVAYEAFIAHTAQVPTREGLHDFFNALCWLHFPLAKRQLNRLQAAEIARDGVRRVRGPVRDACTVFDENAVLLQAPDALWQALRERRWQHALWTLRPLWAQTRLWMFGHAALEKLVRPYKSITVHLWRVPQALAVTQLDAWLASDLQAEKLASKPFVPLPLLGVPGWWPANQDPGFYDDPQVFRPHPHSPRHEGPAKGFARSEQ